MRNLPVEERAASVKKACLERLSHRAIARIARPIWMCVSATGVVICVMVCRP